MFLLLSKTFQIKRFTDSFQISRPLVLTNVLMNVNRKTADVGT